MPRFFLQIFENVRRRCLLLAKSERSDLKKLPAAPGAWYSTQIVSADREHVHPAHKEKAQANALRGGRKKILKVGI